MDKLKSFLWGGAIVFLLVFCHASAVFAYSWAVNAKVTANPVMDSNTPSAAISPSTGILQFIQIPGTIAGPKADGSPNNSEILKSAETPTPNWGTIGQDTVGKLNLGDGKFKHQIGTGGVQGQQSFLCRIWDKDPKAADAKFAESKIFLSFDPNAQEDIDTELTTPAGGNLQTIFPKAAPAGYSTSISVTKGSGSIPPKLTISFDSVLGARNYVVDISKTVDYSIIYKTATVYKDNNHSLFYGTEVGQISTFTLDLSDGDGKTTYYYRVRASNSFGDGVWVPANILIPVNEDPFIPVAITDLQANYLNGSITLSWSPAYDTNNQGVVDACASYDIYVSKEAIASKPVLPFASDQTNSDPPLDTWGNAIPIKTFFSSTPVIPNPKKWGAGKQTLVISSVPAGNYYFAIKAKDASGKESYISNVAGVATGAIAGQTTQNYTLKAGSNTALGITTFGISLDQTKGDITGKTVKDVVVAQNNKFNFKVNLLIDEINKQAKPNTVNAFSYFDASLASPKVVGLVKIGYTNGALDPANSFATTGDKVATILDHPIQVDTEAYQVTLGKGTDLTFTLSGYK